MSVESDISKIEDLEKRAEATQKKLDELKLAIEKLPQPTFTSETHERIYNTSLGIGLTRYVLVHQNNTVLSHKM